MTYRDELDRPLTSVEVDANFRELNTKLDALTKTLNGGAGINVPPDTSVQTALSAVNNTLDVMNAKIDAVVVSLGRKEISTEPLTPIGIKFNGGMIFQLIYELPEGFDRAYPSYTENKIKTIGQVKRTLLSGEVKTWDIDKYFELEIWQQDDPDTAVISGARYEATITFSDKFGILNTATAEHSA